MDIYWIKIPRRRPTSVFRSLPFPSRNGLYLVVNCIILIYFRFVNSFLIIF
jgi:hypothetical protein